MAILHGKQVLLCDKRLFQKDLFHNFFFEQNRLMSDGHATMMHSEN